MELCQRGRASDGQQQSVGGGGGGGGGASYVFKVIELHSLAVRTIILALD